MVDYAGENFVRYTGDTTKHAEAQLFAWEAGHVGVDVHLLAEPTKAEKLKVEYSSKKEQIKSSIQESILERYGGKEHLEAPPKALLLAQTEQYIEYSRSGKIIKGAEKPVVCSRYEEDIYPNNHHSVWGSYWKDGEWGYQCCHSTVKNSYCTGETGKDVAGEKKAVAPPPALMPPPAEPAKKAPAYHVFSSDEDDDDDSDDDVRLARKKKTELPPEEEKTPEEIQAEKEERLKSEARRQKKRDRKKKKKDAKRKEKKKRSKKRHSSSSSSSSSSESEDEEAVKKKKLAKALKDEEERVKKVDRLLAMDERKRPYNSMTAENKAPNEEEMEAYYMKRKRDEDPMAAFM